MKWARRIAIVLAVAVLAVLALALGTARRTAHPVGFNVVAIRGAAGPMAVALWYPTTATPRPTTFANGMLLDVAPAGPLRGEHLPVVLISHGNGGSAFSHVDLAMDLASAGYVVAAPTHPGDNFADPSRQGAPALFSQRAEDLRAMLDYVLTRWPGAARLDRSRIGAFGMSAGAFTVLTLAGGVPDMDAIAAHCRRHPEFVCQALAHAHSPLLSSGAGAGVFVRDPRLRAIVLAAPGLGFTFAGKGLAGVRVPVQVWTGGRDTTVPYATNGAVVEAGLGRLAEPHRLAGASHFSFLAPCGLLRPPAVCDDPAGFDRAASHRAMNAAIIRFFDRQLAPEADARSTTAVLESNQRPAD